MRLSNGSSTKVKCAIFTVLCSLLALSPLSSFANGNISLAWDPSPDSSVVGYKVYYGTASGLYTNSVQTGSATSVTVSNLVEGVTYYFAATSLDTNGWESIFSNETSGMVDVPNQAPTLNALSNISINEDAGIQTVNLAGISSGSTNEIQTLVVTVTSSNPSLIPNPSVSYTSPSATGSLSLTPTANASGSATITVTVNDGGASNNVFSRTFTVTVNSVNDTPTLNSLSNVTINEDAGNQSVSLAGISSGAANESQTLVVTATSSNPSLIPNPSVSYTSPNAAGSISFAPTVSATGSATITVTVNDGGGSNNTIQRTFTVTVNAVNDAPTLSNLSNISIGEDSGLRTVSLAGISSGATNESQTLTVTATSSNPSLIPNPTVSYTSPNATGSIGFTPAANAAGSATITVTVNDGGANNNTISRNFTVTVTSANDAPTLNTFSNLTIDEDAGVQSVNLAGISTGATNEIQTLAVTATSSNPSLIPNPTVTYISPSSTGSLAFTPVAAAFGTATITVTVNDGGASNNTISRSFTVTVDSANDVPTLNTLANVSVNQDAGLQTVNLTGISSGAANENQTLSVTATSSNPSLIPTPTLTYTSPNTTGALAFTPVAAAFGSSTITVTVNDGGASNNTVSRSFTVTVNYVNQAPSISTITNRIIAVNSSIASIPFTIGDAETPATSLTLSAESSNQILLPNQNITLGGSGSDRFITATPAPGRTGVATIIITVSDGTASATSAFDLQVNPRPPAPSNLRVTLQ